MINFSFFQKAQAEEWQGWEKEQAARKRRKKGRVGKNLIQCYLFSIFRTSAVTKKGIISIYVKQI